MIISQYFARSGAVVGQEAAGSEDPENEAFAEGRNRSVRNCGWASVLSTGQDPPALHHPKILQPYIIDEVAKLTNAVFYRTQNGGRGLGYDALLLPRVAEVYLRLRDDWKEKFGEVPTQYREIIKHSEL